MRRTNTYNLETFETGSFYFASSDYRRFTTLDYNFKTYIGIVGNGVLRGWDIKILEGRTIKINPGCGFISGLYAESPWIIDTITKEPKRKNKAIIDGDDIYEEIPGWSSPNADTWVGSFYNTGGSRTYDALVFDKLGPDGEDNNFDGVVDGVLQPHYKEPPDNYFTNPFVKAVPKYLTTFTLEDNSDSYIFAKKVSMNSYDVFANFFVSQTDISDEDNLLLATVVVRNGSVLKISYDGVLKAKSLESASKEITQRLLKQHIHGGDKNWDPPRIKLETDIRECFFVGINNASNVFRVGTEDPSFIDGCIFAILSFNKTEQLESVGHSHYYEMNAAGEGFTHYINSDTQITAKNFHYHTIVNGVVETMVGNYGFTPHTHIVNKTSDITNFNNVVVRINKNIISSKDYEVFVKNNITFFVVKNNLASFKNGQYQSEFELINKATYLFKEESNNLAQFIVDMMSNFNDTFQKETSYENSLTGQKKAITVRNPFVFQINTTEQNLEDGQTDYILSGPIPINTWPTGTVGTLEKIVNPQADLFLQSIIVARNLISDDNEAMIFPNVARFIPIKALKSPKSEKVEIEILQNVEIKKLLSTKNILYIDAENFKIGKFLPEYIPFLNHMESFSRNFNIYKFNTFSNDGSDFRITPILSSLNSDHYHKIWVDKYGNGQTSGTYINDLLVVSETAEITVNEEVQETTVLVDHIHGIEKGIITDTISIGLNQYQGNNVETAHNHYVIKVPNNNSTSIFYVGDDKNGNVFFGTSNGLLNKSKSNGYEINIEGNLYCYEAGNISASLLMATYRNFLRTQRYATFSSDFVKTIEPTLITVGSKATIPSVIVFSKEESKQTSSGEITTTTSEKYNTTNITVRVVDIFPTSDFGRIKSPTCYETYNSEDEEILWENWGETGSCSLTRTIDNPDPTKSPTVETCTIATEVNFHKQPIWNGCILDDGSKFFVSQKKIIRSVINEQGEYWEEIFITVNPFNITRKIIKSGDYLLVCGDNGVKVSSVKNPTSFIDTSLNLDVYDIVEVSSNIVLATTENGLYKTSNTGFTWDLVLSTTGLKEITRDYALDKTTIKDDHFHYLMTDINGGGYTSDAYLEDGSPYPDQHIHEVNAWQIKNILDHNHDIVSTLFFRTDTNKIFKSIDSGNNWVNTTNIPSQYFVETIFAAFGNLFVGTFDKLIYYDGSDWEETDISNRIFCFNWLHNLNGFYIGCNNAVYVSYDGINIIDYFSFDNNLLPICFVNQQEAKNGFVYNNLNQSINFKDVLAVSDRVVASQNYDLFLSQVYDPRIIWEYETFSVSSAAKAKTGENQETTYNNLKVLKTYETGTIVYVSSSGVLPSPLMTNTVYYAISVSNGIIQLAKTYNNASSNIAINITSLGTGEHTIKREQALHDIKYDIVINDSTVLSTKNNIDYRETSGFNFDFNTKTGLIDFAVKSALSSSVNYGDEEISVASSNGFEVGKEIIIYNIEAFIFNGLVKTTATTYKMIEKFDEDGNSLGSTIEKVEVGNQCFWQKEIKRKIVSVSSGVISLDAPIYDNIDAGSVVEQIYNLVEEPDVIVTYYENAQISNIGTKSHSEIEDALSNRSIDVPFKLSEVLLNNFNQLSLYTKYAIPEIDGNFQNWHSFFMRYDRNPANENYIGNFFDLDQSNLQNSSILTGIFNPLLLSSINKIYFGRYDYKEMVFIGTNNGLYAGIPSNNFNNNWFLVPSNAFGSIYDIMSVNNFNTLILSEKGVFVNQNSQMTKWESFSNIVNGSAFFIRYRWINYDNLKYKDWWKQWNYEENTKDADLTNSLILGGRGFVMISNNNGSSWSTSIVKSNDVDFENYEANVFLPLSTGPALLVLNNASQAVSATSKNKLFKSSILEATGLGDLWDSEVFDFPIYNLVVGNIEITEQNNTKITFSKITQALIPFMPQNSLVGLSVFVNNQKTSIVSTSADNVILRGSNISSYLNKNDIITINPMRINDIVETKEGSLIMGTECGLFYDKNTYMDRNRIIGTINGVGKEAIVLAIDIGGFIVSISESSAFEEKTAEEISTTNMLCILDKNVDTNELAGKNFLFLDEIIPKISILFPLPNMSIESSTISVNLNISMFDIKSSGFVAMQLDNGDIQYFSNSNFTISNLSYGRHKLTVFLTDINKNKLNNDFAEKTIYFTNTSNNKTPYIDIEYPENNEIIKAAAFYAKVKIYNFNTFFEGSLAYKIDQESIIIESYQPNNIYNILFNTLTIEKHKIKFMLLDKNNIETGVSQTVSFSLSNDYPSIFLILPSNNSIVTTKDITIKYDIKNFNVPSNGTVKITANDKIFYSTDQISYQLVGLPEGVNHIKVQLVDNTLKNIEGDFTSSSVTITIDTSLQQTPSLAIFTPQDGSIVKTGEATLIYFTVNNFEIPLNGGILIYLNGVLQTFWAKTDPYILTFSTDGAYVINAFLATSADESSKLNNSQSNVKISLVSQTNVATTIAIETSTTPTTSVITPVETTSTTATTEQTTTVEETYFSGISNSFRVISNSASSASGLTLIEINGDISQIYSNMYFKIVGSSSTLYVEYVYPVVDHEFDGGKAYVRADQQDNIYRTYSIKSQVGNTIELTETIASSNNTNELLDVQPKQTILLITSNNEKILFVNLDKSYGQNEFANRLVYFEGVPELKIQVIGNTQRSITLNTKADLSWVETGSSLYLPSVVFSPLNTFNNKKTTKDNDHYHAVELISAFLSGGIERIDKINQGYISVYTKNTVGFDNQMIVDYPDLLQGATATFYPSNNSVVTYYDTIDSIYSDRIIIKTENEDNWNIDHFKTFGIDATFIFEINAEYYGKTTTVYYEDFSIYKTKITQDSLVQEFFVYVNDSDKFNIDDDIKIFNNKGKLFYSKIKDIIDGQKLELYDSLNYSFLINDDSCIVIYKTGTSGNVEYSSETSSEISSNSSGGELNDFNHTHLVKNCEVSLTTMPIFDLVGYQNKHEHGLSNLIGTVKNIIKQNDDGRIITSGTDSIIYYSDDSGDTWQEFIDVKDYIDTTVFGENIYVTSMDVDVDKDLIIGTNVGIIVRQGLDNPNTALLNYPFTEEWLPSSSSSSSTSSISSSSTETSSSSLTSQSTSSTSMIAGSSSSISNTSLLSSSSSSCSPLSSLSNTSGMSSSSCSTYWHTP